MYIPIRQGMTTTRHDTTRHDMTRHDTTRQDYDIYDTIRHDTTRYDIHTVRYGTTHTYTYIINIINYNEMYIHNSARYIYIYIYIYGWLASCPGGLCCVVLCSMEYILVLPTDRPDRPTDRQTDRPAVVFISIAQPAPAAAPSHRHTVTPSHCRRTVAPPYLLCILTPLYSYNT